MAAILTKLMPQESDLENDLQVSKTSPHAILESVVIWSEEKWQKQLQKWINNISLLHPQERLTWLSALHILLNEHQSSEKNALQNKTLTIINEFAGLLCDWQLQIKSCQQLESLSVIEIRSLAYALWKSGSWSESFAQLEHQMLLNPEDNNSYLFYLSLVRQSNAQGFSYFSATEITSMLVLEPLSEHHLDEFFWQYWDPNIAELCCLPQFQNRQHWYDWITQQETLDDQTNYAIRHAEFGFIGVVSLVVHQQVGFFYFWIGKDFQGMGLGTSAVSLLLELGKECFDLQSCYAKVFEHNIASQKALSKLGFIRLSVNAAPPNQNEHLYYLGQAKPEENQALELQQLFINMYSETQVDLPLTMKLVDRHNNRLFR